MERGAPRIGSRRLRHRVHEHLLLVERERLVVAEAVVVVVAVVPRQQPSAASGTAGSSRRAAARPRRLVLREAAVAEGAQRCPAAALDGESAAALRAGRSAAPNGCPTRRFDLRDLERVGELGRLAVGTRRLQERGSGWTSVRCPSRPGAARSRWSSGGGDAVVVVAVAARHLRGAARSGTPCCWARGAAELELLLGVARERGAFLTSTTIWRGRQRGRRGVSGEAAVGVQKGAKESTGEARGRRRRRRAGGTCWWRVQREQPLRRGSPASLDLRVATATRLEPRSRVGVGVGRRFGAVSRDAAAAPPSWA